MKAQGISITILYMMESPEEEQEILYWREPLRLSLFLLEAWFPQLCNQFPFHRHRETTHSHSDSTRQLSEANSKLPSGLDDHELHLCASTSLWSLKLWTGYMVCAHRTSEEVLCLWRARKIEGLHEKSITYTIVTVYKYEWIISLQKFTSRRRARQIEELLKMNKECTNISACHFDSHVWRLDCQCQSTSTLTELLSHHVELDFRQWNLSYTKPGFTTLIC